MLGDAASPSEAGPGGDAAGPTKGGPDRRPPQKLTGRVVTKTLMRRRGRLLACFQRHEGAITAIRVVINSAGAVQEASVVPAGVNATPLGQCVAGVAKSTRFPRHTEPTAAFSIPARVSSKR